jgi:hypothetical protein
MKNRVEYQEEIMGSIHRIPFLKRFLKDKGLGLMKDRWGI